MKVTTKCIPCSFTLYANLFTNTFTASKIDGGNSYCLRSCFCSRFYRCRGRRRGLVQTRCCLWSSRNIRLPPCWAQPSWLHFDFMHASAHAKTVNLATNTASIIFFASTGHVLYEVALPMAACNMAGGFVGTRLALLKGNSFIRVFFLIVVYGTILRFAYDVFLK